MSARQEVRDLMQTLGISPKKSLGQNFLVSDSVIEKIHKSVVGLKPSAIIEIGPGLGSLTRGFRALKIPLYLLELDQLFANYWREQQIPLWEGDALHWNWQQIELPRPLVLVSNLPYQISKVLVVDRSLDNPSLDGMVLMFQKEVAQKLKANNKSEHYGMMSVLAQSFWTIETVLEASSGDFEPAPKVASRVLKFVPLATSIEDRKKFLRFLKACFLHPRKFMLSNLIESLLLEREQVKAVFAGLHLSDKIRAQELSIKQFHDLYFALGNR